MKNIRKAVIIMLAMVMLVTSAAGGRILAATGDEYTVTPEAGKENLSYAGATGTLFNVNGSYKGFCIDRNKGHYSAATIYTEAAGVITDPADKLYQTFYYGYGGPEEGAVYSFANETEAIVATNQAASHFATGSSSGMSYTAAIAGLDSSLIPPKHDMSLSDTTMTAYESGGRQVTDWVTLTLDPRLTARAVIPDGVTLWIEGESAGHTGTADIRGGRRFYLSAPTDCDGIKNVTISYIGNRMLKIIILDPPDNSYQPVAFYTKVNPSVNLSASFTGTGEIELIKSSQNPAMTTGNGCYSLAGAVYGIYGSYGNAYNDVNRIASITTDVNGYGKASDLTCGTYYIKEITAPKGFKLDKGIYTASVTAAAATRLNLTDAPGNDPLEIVVRKKDADEDIYLNGARFVVKYYDVQMDSDPAQAGYSAVRTWYLVTKDGTNYSGAAALNVNCLDPSRTSDAFYYASSGDPTIPYGTITVQEYEAPAGYILDDTVFSFRITADMGSTPTVDLLNARTITNERFRAYLRIIKKDAVTNENILNNHAKFKIWSYSDNAYISLNSKDVFETNDSGELMTPDVLYAGKYRIEEVSAPEGYLLSDTAYDIDISTDAAYDRYVDENGVVTNMGVFTVEVKNTPVRGCIKIHKTGERITDAGSGELKSVYADMSGIEFMIIADEDIYSMGNLVHRSGELIETITTGTDGNAVSGNELLPGRYIVREKTPEGYVRADDIVVTIDSSEVQNGIAYRSIDVENSYIRGRVKLIKRDMEDTSKVLPGVKFKLYKVHDIDFKEEQAYMSKYNMLPEDLKEEADKHKLSSEDIYIGDYVTDENGEINIDNLCYGDYYFVETEALYRYNLNTQAQLFSITEDQDEAEINMTNDGRIGYLVVWGYDKPGYSGSHPSTGDGFGMASVVILMCSLAGLLLLMKVIKDDEV